MKGKRITGTILAFAVLLSGCNAKTVTDETSQEIITASEEITETATESVTEVETTAEGIYEFNPHLHSGIVGDAIPEDYYESLYNLIDALRKGKDTFECSSEEAYKWATDSVTLNNLFPAACVKISGESNDGTVPF